MSKNHKKLFIGICVVIFFSIFSLAFFSDLPKKEMAKAEISNEFGTILTGNLKTFISFAPNTLFYDALIQERNVGKIEFSGKNYPGLGFFVTDIGGLHAGNGKNLVYYINGKEATVGVSSYTLKDKDVIEWKLE